MFSERSRWMLSTNRLTLAVRARLSRGLPLHDLTEANPTRLALALALPDSHAEAFARLSSPEVRDYAPDPRGLMVAREAVSGYYSSRGQSVDPGQITLSASTSEAYGWIFKLLCDPGDELIVLRPGYPLFEDLAKLENVVLVSVPMRYHGRWELDLDALAQAVTERTRGVLLVHPNNPTGSFVQRAELNALCDLCEKHRFPLVSDEVFGDYAYARDPSRVPSFTELTRVLCFTLSGLSKVAAAPQVKLGWIVVTGPRQDAEVALERLEMIADCYLSVSASAQHAARDFLSGYHGVCEAIRKRVTHNRAALADLLGARSPATLLRAEGGWYATLEVPRTLGEEDRVVSLVEREGVLVHPGYFFDFEREAFLVLSLLPEARSFEEGVQKICQHLGRE